MGNNKKWTTIAISQPAKDALDSIKHTGQSYDGLIQELTQFWIDKKDEYWARGRDKKGVRSSAR